MAIHWYSLALDVESILCETFHRFVLWTRAEYLLISHIVVERAVWSIYCTATGLRHTTTKRNIKKR